jgi:hypothetical protein
MGYQMDRTHAKSSDEHEDDVDDGEEDLPRRGEVLSLIEMEPEDTFESESEPAGE